MRNFDGGPGFDNGPQGSCDPTADMDGDGIADFREGSADPDLDGIPAELDLDSDGDGISDAMEAGTDPCGPPNSDGDDFPDFLDTDSDNDGLTDAEEVAAGTNPRSNDSDGDGIPDLVELRGSRTDPNDASSSIPATDFFVVLPYNGNRENRTLDFGTNIEVADIFFLVDMTGSMQGERTNLINGLLTTIVPGIQAAIPNVQFGAGGFDDYPTGPSPIPYGAADDLPFYLLREIDTVEMDRGSWSLAATPTTCPMGGMNDIGMITGAPDGRPDILEAIEGLPCHNGADGAESYVPALFSTATGLGLTWPGGSVPARTCPAIPDEPVARQGYPCFRPGALPIILLFGDANFHNGPGGSQPYTTFSGAPSFENTAAALNSIGARVISIFSGGAASLRADYEAMGRTTGTVDGSGNPLVFDIDADGSGLDSAVVNAVANLVNGTPQDVRTGTQNVPGNPDEFDATQFIKSITPVEGYVGATPGIGYDSFDETTFYGVIPGTRVEFAIDFYNDVRVPAAVAEVFVAQINVLGNGVANLDQRRVYILVPTEGGVILL